MKAFLREILVTLLLGVIIFALTQITIQSFIVVGPSMEPSFQNGQRLLINKIVYRFHNPERGDVIIFHPPNSPQSDYIKRIIALPGDTVEIKTGVVYVNSSQLSEPYINDPPNYTLQQQKIPDNHYFVLGDNRNNSSDSHNGWTVPSQNIIGKTWLSIWPPNRWQLVANYSITIATTSFMTKQSNILAKG